MFGKPPLYIPDSFAVEVRDLQAASSWYKEKLGFRDAPSDIGDDSGRPYVVLQLGKDQYVSRLTGKLQQNGPTVTWPPFSLREA
jgi:hypothetical protein